MPHFLAHFDGPELPAVVRDSVRSGPAPGPAGPFPNLVGVYFLSGKLKGMLDEYWVEYREGRFRVYERGAAASAEPGPVLD